jgi:hypothetical protein
LIVNIVPANVELTDRASGVVFADTEYDIVPFPVPLLPDVIVIHDTLLEAVHEHPAWVVTDTLPVPPEAPKLALVGEIE